MDLLNVFKLFGLFIEVMFPIMLAIHFGIGTISY